MFELGALQPSHKAQHNAFRHMSTFRDSSPTSYSEAIQANTASQSQKISLAFSNRVSLKDGGRNAALAAASFAGTGKQSAVGIIGKAKQTYDKPLIDSKAKSVSETNEKHRNSAQPAQAWEPSAPHIAALLAVKKSLHTQSNGLFPNPTSRPMNLQRTCYDSAMPKMQTDKTPIPPTNTLIKLFELREEDHPSRTSGGLPHAQNPPPKVRSSRSTQRESVNSEILRTAEHPKLLEKAKPNINGTGGEPPWVSKSSETAVDAVINTTSSAEKSDQSEPVTSRRGPAPPLPPPRRIRKGDEVAQQDRWKGSTVSQSSEGNSSPSSYTSAVASLEPPAGVGKLTGDIPNTKVHTPLSPSHKPRLPKRPSPSPLHAKTSFGKDDHLWVGRGSSRESTLDPRSRTPQLTADSLANAMVASSLASSRASSPSKPTPPLPRRQSRPHSFLAGTQSEELIEKRTPSPGRTMRQTMRETPKSDEEADRKRRRGHILKKHPNKHHEGDRKRWRHEITERERKRYEGVWAANKGLLVPSELPDSDITVLNLVVRDIWRRSRLPNEVLAEVWDLVDGSGVGRLAKEEFVVGMWLIDQRLKGRKLPVRVSESVWFSAKRLSGLKPTR